MDTVSPPSLPRSQRDAPRIGADARSTCTSRPASLSAALPVAMSAAAAPRPATNTGLAVRLRGLVLAATAPVLGRLLFRLCLGRAPVGDEARQFRDGLLDRTTPLPPCCRAMLAVPAAEIQVGRMLLFGLVRSGEVEARNPLDGLASPAEATALPAQSGNPLHFWRGPPLAFLHLEKTAGSSLTTVLTDAFHPLQIDPDPRRTEPPHRRGGFARPAETRRHALIFGHYDLPSLRRLDPGRLVVTMLRDPAARILSLYYYWRSIAPDLLHSCIDDPAVGFAHRAGLLEFLSTDDPAVLNHIDNLYARRLTGLYVAADGEDRLRAAPEAGLRVALANLDGLDVVGLTERMADSVAVLGAQLGVPVPAEMPADNVTAANVGADAARGHGRFRSVPRETLTAQHRRALARLTSLDRGLYKAAGDRLSATMAGCIAPSACLR